MTRYWFDTEFMEDGRVIELLSIGVVCEDGREFYAESSEADLSHANEWVQENVIPHLWHRQPQMSDARIAANRWIRDGGTGGLLTRASIAGDLRRFVAQGASGDPRRFVAQGDDKPEFWAYYGDYDWVVLCQLYGRMIDLPDGWPMFAMDLKQEVVNAGNPELPAHEGVAHNALEDARWTKTAHLWLLQREGVE